MSCNQKIVDSCIRVLNMDGFIAAAKKCAVAFPDLPKYPKMLDVEGFIHDAETIFHIFGFWVNISLAPSPNVSVVRRDEICPAYEGRHNLCQIEAFFTSIAPFVEGYIIYLYEENNYLTQYTFKDGKVTVSTADIVFKVLEEIESWED